MNVNLCNRLLEYIVQVTKHFKLCLYVYSVMRYSNFKVREQCFFSLLQNSRQSLLSLHMTKSYVRTATRSTLKVEANLTQILHFKANFHTEFEPFFKKKIYANNGGHFKIVSIKIKN